MDQHPVRLMRGECFEAEPHRILPFRAARYRLQHRQAHDRAVEQCAVFGPDRDQNPSDPRMRRKGVDRMAQHRRAAERQILLWQIAAKPCATASGNDQGAGCGHRVNVW